MTEEGPPLEAFSEIWRVFPYPSRGEPVLWLVHGQPSQVPSLPTWGVIGAPDSGVGQYAWHSRPKYPTEDALRQWLEGIIEPSIAAELAARAARNHPELLGGPGSTLRQ